MNLNLEVHDWDQLIFNNFAYLGLIDFNTGRNIYVFIEDFLKEVRNFLKTQKKIISFEELKEQFEKNIEKQIFLDKKEDGTISLKKKNLDIYEKLNLAFNEISQILEKRGLETSFQLINFRSFSFKIQEYIYTIKISIEKLKNNKNIILKLENNEEYFKTANFKSIISSISNLIEISLGESELDKIIHPRLVVDGFIIQNLYLIGKKCVTDKKEKTIDIQKFTEFIKEKNTSLNSFYLQILKREILRIGPSLIAISTVNNKKLTFKLNDNLAKNLRSFFKGLYSIILNSFSVWEPKIIKESFNMLKIIFKNDISVSVKIDWNSWIWKSNNLSVILKLDNIIVKDLPNKLSDQNIDKFQNFIENYIKKKLDNKIQRKPHSLIDYKNIIEYFFKIFELGKKRRRFISLEKIKSLTRVILEENNIKYNEKQLMGVITKRKKFKSFILNLEDPNTWSDDSRTLLLECTQNTYFIIAKGEIGKYIDKNCFLKVFQQVLQYYGLETENLDILLSNLMKLKPGHITIPAGQIASDIKILMSKRFFSDR